MKLTAFSYKEGFQEVHNFIQFRDNESNHDLFKRLGYSNQHEGLFSASFSHWLEVYKKDDSEGDYQYIVVLGNHFQGEIVALKRFGDYIEFMRRYLPVIKSMNDIVDTTEKLRVRENPFRE